MYGLKIVVYHVVGKNAPRVAACSDDAVPRAMISVGQHHEGFRRPPARLVPPIADPWLRTASSYIPGAATRSRRERRATIVGADRINA